MRRFFLLFLLIQGVLFTVEIRQTAQESVIVPWTELIAATSPVGWTTSFGCPPSLTVRTFSDSDNSGFRFRSTHPTRAIINP